MTHKKAISCTEFPWEDINSWIIKEPKYNKPLLPIFSIVALEDNPPTIDFKSGNDDLDNGFGVTNGCGEQGRWCRDLRERIGDWCRME